MAHHPITLSLPAPEYRSLPIPGVEGQPGVRPKISSFFVRAGDLPEVLGQWMTVNPRVPEFDKKDRPKGAVATAIITTLEEEPERFALRNQGIWLLVERATFLKAEGGAGRVEITLSDPESHGLVNGGHTFHAIQWVRAKRDPTEPWEAYVRVHVLEGIDPGVVTDLASGLNTSAQVDDPSIANLAGVFDDIKKVMRGRQGADQIAYKQGEPGEVDILQVLTFMAFFNLKAYPDRKRHPNNLFGHQKDVLELFERDMESPDSAFKRILPKVPEILRLADRIPQVAFEKCAQRISKVKTTDARTAKRAGDDKYKDLPAHFAGGKLGGLFHLGWLFPALAAFRANVSKEHWERGEFQWRANNEEVLHAAIDEIVDVIIREHQDNRYKPAEVGRRDAAYRLCYSAVTMALAADLGVSAD